MLDRSDLIYRYDGSFDGMLCCVFESFYAKERPGSIQGPDAAQMMLLEEKNIATDVQKAQRVRTAIAQKISAEALGFVLNAYRTCLPERELAILDFLRLGFRIGARVISMLSDPIVNRLHKAVNSLQGEAHLLTGFVRFSDYNGALSCIIDPRNDVLPLMMQHFLERYPNEAFLIFDRTHRRALGGFRGKGRIFPLEDLELPEATAEEQTYRLLWQKYYDTIAIEGRENPVCRRTHMPKRFWKNMTEFQRPADSFPANARRLAQYAR